MLKKRIIPCLDIHNGRTVKGINFVKLRDAGEPVELGKQYALQGADELVFLDISATNEKRKTLIPLVEKIAREINIPFTVGGGVSSVQDAEALIRAGADKITVNSAAVRRPVLIREIASEFGSQCVVVAVDAQFDGKSWNVYVNGGSRITSLKADTWGLLAQDQGAGEILFTSMNHDGTENGFANEIYAMLSRQLSIPLIASGGAGKPEDFKDLFRQTDVSAALAASVFHYGQIALPELKSYLKTQNIPIR